MINFYSWDLSDFEENDMGVKMDTKSTGPYVMPKPATLVLWRHVPGGETSPAIVTRVGKQAIDVMVFPTDSRVGFPKVSVIHSSDPRVKTLVSPDSGVWDYTEETLDLMKIKEALGGADGIGEFLKRMDAQYR